MRLKTGDHCDRRRDKRLLAYYTADALLDLEQLRSHLSASMPNYMVPAAYVRVNALPLTPNGKLGPQGVAGGRMPMQRAVMKYRQARPKSHWQPSGAMCSSSIASGRHDNFFELAVHSLLAVWIAKWLNSLKYGIILADRFPHPILKSLAA